MKLTINTILNSIESINNIGNTPLPIKVSYAIAKNMKDLGKEIDIYNEERKKLIEKYSVKDEHDQTIVREDGLIDIQPKFVKQWNKDLQALLDIEVDVKIHKFSQLELLSSNVDITPAEIISIDFMIE